MREFVPNKTRTQLFVKTIYMLLLLSTPAWAAMTQPEMIAPISQPATEAEATPAPETAVTADATPAPEAPAAPAAPTEPTEPSAPEQLTVPAPLVPAATPETPPVAEVAVKTSTGTQCNEFTFDATGSYDPDKKNNLSYLWDFGDGQTSDQPVITHTYATSGKYSVKLSVTDNSNLECSTAITSQSINVNLPPKAVAEVSTALVCAKQEMTFDASKSQSDKLEDLSYNWDFGDGTKQEGKTVTKAYTSGADYEVTLVVDDNAKTGCSTDRVKKTVRVNEPPVADAGNDIIRSCIKADKDQSVTFSASGTKDANNDTLTYMWDFGDGAIAEGNLVEHTYPKSGRYNAKLTVTDNSGLSCNSSSDEVLVKLNKAPEANAGKDISICLGETLELDGSGSYVEPDETLFAKWDFGDGDSERGLNVQHVYNRVGKYLVTLTVENAYSTMCPPSVDTKLVTVNRKPTVALKPVGISCVGQEIAFDASSSKDPDGHSLEYFWSFGDGEILKGGPKVTHKYEKGGTYKVTVVTDDNQGSDCSSVSDNTIVKINTPPTANPGTNTACCVDKETVFDATSSNDLDGDKLSYHWDFGDGQTAEKALVTHVYLQGGEYPVKLTVEDNSGTACSSASEEFTAAINQTPVPVIQIK